METKRFKFRYLILGLPILFYLPLLPSCIMAHSPKYGRVIDATTGNGISDVAVIAAGEVTGSASFSPETRTATETEYRVIARTDENGNYRIPSTWLDLTFGHFFPFFGSATERWMLTAFKPGYVLTEDEKAWARTDLYGRHPNQAFRSIRARPPSLWLGISVKVDPMLMNQAQLSTGEAAKYYNSVALLGSPGDWKEMSDEEVAFIKTGSQFFLPKVCDMNPQEKIDWGGNMETFVLDHRKFIKRLDQLEPDNFRITKNPAEPEIFRAATVCDAMKAGGAVQN